MEQKTIKIFFVWHWLKKTSEDAHGTFAVFDSLMFAIRQLSKLYNVKIICLSEENSGKYFCKEQEIEYVFLKTEGEIIKWLSAHPSDVIFINHHSKNYKGFLKEINNLKALKLIYYSSPILIKAGNFKSWIMNLLSNSANKELKKLDYHFVHHDYQKKQLLSVLKIDEERVLVAPKTADLEIFRPAKEEKKWDCVYPGRCTEGYWKRPELAIEACAIARKTLVMPGAKLTKAYKYVTVFNNWLNAKELADVFNKSKCMVITSDDTEMGPRVIPESAACNLPIICCSDSSACSSHIKKIGGFIARPDPSDLAEKIRLAVNTICNTRQQLIDLNYTYDLLFNKILKIIKKHY